MAQEPLRRALQIGSYILDTDLLAIRTFDHGKWTIRLPKGAMVRLVDEPIGSTRFVDVLWENAPVTVFFSDLQDRGSLVPGQ